MEEVKDFLGTPIHVGDRGLFIYSYSHFKCFHKITIVEVNPDKTEYGQKVKNCIGILTDGNTKIGWTYPERILVQGSLNVKI